MKDYSKMRDFEITEAVAQHVLWKKKDCEEIHGDEKLGVVSWAYGANWRVFDPCNNPSDAWPIMKESLIGVTPDEDGVTMHFYGGWTARAHCKNLQFTDKNPLRAAMIVYLMMKDEEKCES